MKIKKGSIDYDLDRYGRKIRKYVCSKLVKKGKFFEPVWTQDTDFKPEYKIPKHKLEVLIQRW